MIKLIFSISKLFLLLIIMNNFSVIFRATYAKNLNYKMNIDQNINQLHQISNAHSECLIQIQQQLAENQRNIDILRDHIQNIQHCASKMKDDQKKSSEKLNEIINYYNKTCAINNDFNQLSKKSESKTHKIKKNTIQQITHDHAYKQAVSLVLEKKQYDQAIQSFQNFIKNYPDSDYQANAHYWLGQLYYNNNNKDQASYYFALVTKNYPKSTKAPDALFKLGIIMQETNKNDEAKIIYRQIGKLYPNSNAAKQAQKYLARL